MIACFGDSLTYGFGLRPGDRWIDIVRNRGYDINNYGVNGARIRDIMARIQENPLPDYVFVMGGTNDFDSGGSVESLVKAYLEIDSYLTSQGVQPIYGIPTPTNPKIAEYKNLSNKLSFFHDELLLTFPRNQLIDFFHAFTPYDSNLFFDEIHPNKKGSRKMAEVFLKEWSF
ncbi:MAG: hypothetical protein KHZ78_00150 [Peptoniphilus sp. oral taxon 375]|uniref:SGNH/GDSL hydrolase family protein n=1 Tax=Urinicoccus timonensis TaxID=2024205 RepID=UPI00021A2E2B|nr:GDSL-type esterase/lipase family protein [Urinicoccus timonensis]EGS31559.1 GDSL-like protein [Peptoniphilus sp. oral taxon 375 str. F0436]MBS4871241.1 hypothetical protein [Peptoniphilus sp. oral taxon 375]